MYSISTARYFHVTSRAKSIKQETAEEKRVVTGRRGGQFPMQSSQVNE